MEVQKDINNIEKNREVSKSVKTFKNFTCLIIWMCIYIYIYTYISVYFQCSWNYAWNYKILFTRGLNGLLSTSRRQWSDLADFPISGDWIFHPAFTRPMRFGKRWNGCTRKKKKRKKRNDARRQLSFRANGIQTNITGNTRKRDLMEKTKYRFRCFNGRRT